MDRVIVLAVSLCGFLAIYEVVRRRASRRAGVKPPIQWGWLTAIIVLVLIVSLIGALSTQ